MRIARTLAIALTFVTSTLVARADSFSISGNVYAGSDMMGFKVSSLLDGGSQWRSAAPCCGPPIVAISQMGQKTTFDFTAFAWQGEGFAEATGPWGTTTNLGGSIFVLGTILFNSSLTGSVSIKVPVLVVGNLQALDANTTCLERLILSAMASPLSLESLMAHTSSGTMPVLTSPRLSFPNRLHCFSSEAVF